MNPGPCRRAIYCRGPDAAEPRPGPQSLYGSEPALKGSVPSASETPLSELLAFM